MELLYRRVFLVFLYFIYLDSFSKENISKAYITNQGDNTVSVINLNSLKKVKTINVGVAPLGITVLQKKQLVFIGNVGKDFLVDLRKKIDHVLQIEEENIAKQKKKSVAIPGKLLEGKK